MVRISILIKTKLHHRLYVADLSPCQVNPKTTNKDNLTTTLAKDRFGEGRILSVRNLLLFVDDSD